MWSNASATLLPAFVVICIYFVSFSPYSLDRWLLLLLLPPLAAHCNCQFRLLPPRISAWAPEFPVGAKLTIKKLFSMPKGKLQDFTFFAGKTEMSLVTTTSLWKDNIASLWAPSLSEAQ